MNEFLDFNKPEILVEKRTKVHNQLIITPTSIAAATVRTNFPTITKILDQRAVNTGKKRNYRNRTEQRVAPLKILESVLFPLFVVFYSSIVSLSAATINFPPIATNRFTEQEIQLLREAFLRKYVF